MSNESRRISLEELYQLVWLKPTRNIAREFGISDVGLGKICKRLNVPKPPPGYWQRIASGYKVKTPPLPRLGKGQRNEVTIWPTTPKPKSEVKNPALTEALATEKLPDKRIVVSEDLGGAHSLVSYTNKVLSKAKPDSYGRLMLPWNTKVERPYLDLRVSKQALHRSLRIMDALLKAMEARGHDIDSDKGPRLVVNEENINFYILEKVKRNERELTPAEKERPWIVDRWIFTPNGELTFTIDEVWIERKNWRDRKNKPLEDQLNDIVIGIVTAAEMIRLKNIEREAEMQCWREEELRRQEAKLRQEIQRELSAELETQCNLWIRSRRLKRFLRQCEISLSKASPLGSDCDGARWLDWARALADSLDPLQHGGVEQAIRNYRENSTI
ncbi:MAG TPA: hypothetical protein DCK93_14140 [Blastocatellia bacterium]|jgi:hypothetical protein|nr:hypothetical protein [Blastocatellia bacterium]